MAKVYPNSSNSEMAIPLSGGKPVTLTVWKKSLLFNCNGFTVFDEKGNLVFRVDNYVAGDKGEIVLMDNAGKPLLTIRKKRLSLKEQWLVYEEETTVKPLFSVTKVRKFGHSKSLAHVTFGTSKTILYEIEGSYSQRCCDVYDNRKQHLAGIKKKEVAVNGATFGGEVFHLMVEPGFNSAVSMAFVILLEQMFGRRRSHISR